MTPHGITAEEVAEAAWPWIWCTDAKAEPFREVCRRLGGPIAEEVARFDAATARTRELAAEERAQRQAARIARGPRHPDAELRERVYARDGHKCLHCGATKRLTADHIIPWSKGGRTEYENLQTLCVPCNLRKGDR